MDKRGVFRVNYYVSGQSTTAFVCCFSETEAAIFLGVRDGSAAVSRVAYPVEVDGLDAAHDALVPPEPFKAPYDLPKSVSRADFNALQQEVNDLRAQVSGAGKPVSLEPTQVQADPLPKE
jgi:hypothetical protein